MIHWIVTLILVCIGIAVGIVAALLIVNPAYSRTVDELVHANARLGWAAEAIIRAEKECATLRWKEKQREGKVDQIAS